MSHLFLPLFLAGFMVLPISFELDYSLKNENERIVQTYLGNCMEAYFGKPEELLTPDLVGNYIDFEGATPEVVKVSEQIIKDPNFAQVNCEWKVKNKRRKVRLKQIKKIVLYDSKTATERFYAMYHTRSDTEQVELEKTYKEEVQDKVDKEGAEMIGGGMDMKFEYTNVEGLGVAAVWEHKVNDLIVLVGNYTFKLTVDLNQGNEYDLEKAKQIAEAIVAKACP